MRRLGAALSEWLRLRARVREEFTFHLDQTVADLVALGLSPREARRSAGKRLLPRRNLAVARRELGADLGGLLALLIAHRVSSARLFQPLAIVVASLALLLLGPAPRAAFESAIGMPLSAADRQAVFISRQARNLSYQGVTQADFAALRSLKSLSAVEPYRAKHARAQVAGGVGVAAIEAELQVRVGSGQLRVLPLADRHPIVMGPARALWALLLLIGLWSSRRLFRQAPGALYVPATGCLHAFGSLILWACLMQVWLGLAWRTDGRAALALLVLFLGYAGVSVLQLRWWLRDLQRRCPACLNALLLSVTAGTNESVVLDCATTESLCAHGHGVLVESRWMSRFRPQRSCLI